MAIDRRRCVGFVGLVACLAWPARARAQSADTSFAGLVTRLSEAPGYFDTDNIISNEASYLQVASQLAKVGVHGGAYIGVGPDQNFSYIALVHPSVAFMLDVRRDNLLEHLLFKSLFAMSRNRFEYLCQLFGKPMPADADAWTGRPTTDVVAYLKKTPADSAAAKRARTESDRLITAFGVPLDARDRTMIERYRGEFIADGLDTRYSSIGRNNRFGYPSFEDLMLATDRAGRQISYLADEDAFQYVRSMEMRDRIIPVVGNVAGPRAVKAIGDYAVAHGIKISVYYISNVEQYLMGRDGGFDVYAANVKVLPRDSTSVIIRSYFGRGGGVHPLFVPAPDNISASMVETIDSFLHRVASGEVHTYGDLAFGGYVKP